MKERIDCKGKRVLFDYDCNGNIAEIILIKDFDLLNCNGDGRCLYKPVEKELREQGLDVGKVTSCSKSMEKTHTVLIEMKDVDIMEIKDALNLPDECCCSLHGIMAINVDKMRRIKECR